MPLGLERFNVRQKRPNARIIFVKALEGPDKTTAEDFLNRIAAICAPIMRANHLSITTLEEYEPNREFVGRNFNGGEVIQLVLKARSGQWLPFRYVQMVMMHELAHCIQMNHSKAFWKVRNQYADELRTLWAKNYTGDGLWGRGQTLHNGQYTEETMPPTEEMPEHLCGGTYRSSRRGKRKRTTEKPKLTYAERKQRRIEKKFGTNGVELGGDLASKVPLKSGRLSDAKPRVASSQRGRELRAAAALARLEQSKKEEIKEEDSETETDDEPGFEEADEGVEAVDKNGEKLRDSEGRGMVKVCEEDDIGNDADAQNELAELNQIHQPLPASTLTRADDALLHNKREESPNPEDDVSSDAGEDEAGVSDDETAGPSNKDQSNKESDNMPAAPEDVDTINEAEMTTATAQSGSSTTQKISQTCQVCSLDNEPLFLTCAACANVLDVRETQTHWHCKSKTCVSEATEGNEQPLRPSPYVNSGDGGVCGVCGERRGANSIAQPPTLSCELEGNAGENAASHANYSCEEFR